MDINVLRYNLQQERARWATLPNPPITVQQRQMLEQCSNNIQQLELLIRQHEAGIQYAQMQQYQQPQQYGYGVQQPVQYGTPQYPTVATYPNMGIATNFQNVNMQRVESNASISNDSNKSFDSSKIPTVGAPVQQTTFQPVQQETPKVELVPETGSEFEIICHPGITAKKVEDYSKGTYRYELEGFEEELPEVKTKLLDNAKCFSIYTMQDINTQIPDADGVNAGILKNYINIELIVDDARAEEVIGDKDYREYFNSLTKDLRADNLISIVTKIKEASPAHCSTYAQIGTAIWNMLSTLILTKKIKIDNFLADYEELADMIKNEKNVNTRNELMDVLTLVITELKKLSVTEMDEACWNKYKAKNAKGYYIPRPMDLLVIQDNKLFSALSINDPAGIGIIRKNSFATVYKAIDEAFKKYDSTYLVLLVNNSIGLSKRFDVYKHKDGSYILVDTSSGVYKFIINKANEISY